MEGEGWRESGRYKGSRGQIDESYSTLKNFNERAGCPALVVRSLHSSIIMTTEPFILLCGSFLHVATPYGTQGVEPPPPIRGLVWHDDLAVLVGKTQSNMSIPKATHTIMST
jgi:hypothetical protein